MHDFRRRSAGVPRHKDLTRITHARCSFYREHKYSHRGIGFPLTLRLQNTWSKSSTPCDPFLSALSSNGSLSRTLFVLLYPPRALLRLTIRVFLSLFFSISLPRSRPRPTVSQSIEEILSGDYSLPTAILGSSSRRRGGHIERQGEDSVHDGTRREERNTNVSLAEKFPHLIELSRGAGAPEESSPRGGPPLSVVTEQRDTHWALKDGTPNHPGTRLGPDARDGFLLARITEARTARSPPRLDFQRSRENQPDTSPRFYRYLGRCLSARSPLFALCP